jgi:hypothetical protein
MRAITDRQRIIRFFNTATPDQAADMLELIRDIVDAKKSERQAAGGATPRKRRGRKTPADVALPGMGEPTSAADPKPSGGTTNAAKS